jgi:unsaturated chondroitin disaccharide hydrolase
MYRYTKDEAWFNTFQKAIHFYMHRLPNDLVPYWDLIFTDGDEPRDSSSAAITICGLLEMANTLDTMSLSQRDEAHLIQKSNKSSESSKSSEIDVSAEQLRVIAKQMTASLTEKYTASNKTDGLLLHATYSKKSPYNTCTQEGVDECVTWGDYFYMEALHRLDKVGWGGYW